MSENGEIYTAGQNFPLPSAVTNLTSGLTVRYEIEKWLRALLQDANDYSLSTLLG